MSKDLQMYKLIEEYAVEKGWSGDEFYVIIQLGDVEEFVKKLRNIVGDVYFEDDGMCVRIQLDNVIFDELNVKFDEFDFEGMYERKEW